MYRPSHFAYHRPEMDKKNRKVLQMRDKIKCMYCVCDLTWPLSGTEVISCFRSCAEKKTDLLVKLEAPNLGNVTLFRTNKNDFVGQLANRG